MLPGTGAQRCNPSGEEVLFVVSGSGTLIPPAGEPRALAPGDAVHIAGCPAYELAAGSGAAVDYVSAQWHRGEPADNPVFTVRSFDREGMVWNYEMYLQDLYSAAQIPGLPFGSVFGAVAPRSVSKHHCHQDGEIFLILGGRAEVALGKECREVVPGDLVFLTPFTMHGIRNDSDDPLNLASMYWEDIEAAGSALADHSPRLDIAERTVIFCPPPTPNGDLHLGHLAGPYLRADVYARALRTLGREAHLVTGTDDHQSYVAATAHRLGTTPTELATTAAAKVTGTLRAAGFDATRIYWPLRDQGHEVRMRELFTVVAASPAVSRTEVETPWCDPCRISLYQAFANGGCPTCGEKCVGEICEACGRPNDARELVGLACGQCGAAPTSRKESALLLDLDHFAADLDEYLARLEGSGQLLRLVQQLREDGLGRYRITRDSAWGIGLTDHTLPGQVIDPWVELALTQLDNAEQFGAGGDATTVTFLGYDNSYYYAVLLPALAFAAERDGALPRGFVTNRFLYLNGAKFSTSRGHAVWADDLLGKAPADVVRLALLRRSPEETIADITADEVAVMSDDPFLGELREWLEGFAGLPGEGVVPGTGAWTPAHREFYRQLGLLTEELDGLLVIDAFSCVAYVEGLESLVRRARRFHAAEQAKRALTAKKEEARTSVAMEYVAAKAFAGLAYPVMPSVGSELWTALGLPSQPLRETNWSFIPSGTRTHITMPSALAVA
ncbi:MAG: class I tRNA ligase family protein [Pseudonocardiaceae bacterium]